MPDATTRVEATIPGRPFPCPRPRWGQGRTFKPGAYQDWLNGAMMLLRNAAVEQNGGRLIHSDVSVRLWFYGAHGSSDLDNLVKSVLDAAQGQVFDNDRQVTHLVARKFKSKEKSTRVEFTEVGDEASA